MSNEVILVTGSKSPTDFGPETVFIIVATLVVSVYFAFFKGHPERITKAKDLLKKLFGKAKKTATVVTSKVNDKVAEKIEEASKPKPAPVREEPALGTPADMTMDEMVKRIIVQDRIIKQQEAELARVRAELSEEKRNKPLKIDKTVVHTSALKSPPPIGFL